MFADVRKNYKQAAKTIALKHSFDATELTADVAVSGSLQESAGRLPRKSDLCFDTKCQN